VSVTDLLSQNPFRLVRDLKSRLGDLDQRVAALDGRLAAAATHEQVQSLLTIQSNTITESLNALNINLLVASQDAATSLVEASNKSLRELLNAMNADLLAYTERRLAELAEEYYELLMRSRRAAFAQNRSAGVLLGKADCAAPPVRKDNAPALEDVFASLACRAPAAWPIFKQALDVGTRSYEGFPVGSCSVEGHREAERFGAFIMPYLRGYVLDVGCGPQPVPSYLRDYPVALIRGIDPISKPEDHPFEFASAMAEDIPWRDASFDVVCSGTTLDHFFLLDVALKETRRVLKPGGHFVAWISEAPGSAPYDPYRDNIVAADEEHLFHIDRAWFLSMMHELGFEEVEILALSVPFKHLYMAFRKPDA